MTRTHPNARPRTRRSALPATLLLALALGGCEHPNAEPSPASALRADGRGTAPLPAETLLGLAPRRTPPTLPERDEALLDQLLRERERVIAELPSDRVLNEMELVFASSRRLFDLADLYLDALHAHGEDSHVRSRLAWVYQRIGMPTAALRESDACVTFRPDDARCHFVRAFVVAQLPSAPQRLPEIRDGFARVLALDPDFAGPGGVDANELRAQIERLDARIGAPAAHDHDHDHDQDHHEEHAEAADQEEAADHAHDEDQAGAEADPTPANTPPDEPMPTDAPLADPAPIDSP